MKNAHVARLDRQLRLHGEWVQVYRQISGVRRHILNTKAIVKTFATEQIVGGITATNYLVILSPTDMHDREFPGAVPDTVPSGVVPASDPHLPGKGDAINIRGAQKAIDLVSAIYDRDQVVRIEIKVVG